MRLISVLMLCGAIVPALGSASSDRYARVVAVNPTPLHTAGGSPGGLPTPKAPLDESLYPVASALKATLRWSDGSTDARLSAISGATFSVTVDGGSVVDISWLLDGMVLKKITGAAHDPADVATFAISSAELPKSGTHALSVRIDNPGSNEGHAAYVPPAPISYEADASAPAAKPTPSTSSENSPVDALQFAGFLVNNLKITSKVAGLTGTGSSTIAGNPIAVRFTSVSYKKIGTTGNVSAGSGALVIKRGTTDDAVDAGAPSDFCDPFVRSQPIAGGKLQTLNVPAIVFKRFEYSLGLAGLALAPVGQISRAALCYFPGMRTQSINQVAVDGYVGRSITEAQKQVGVDASVCDPSAASQKKTHKPLCNFSFAQGVQLANLTSSLQTIVDAAPVGVAVRNVPLDSTGSFASDVDGSRIPMLSLSEKPLFQTTPSAASTLHLHFASGSAAPHVTYDAVAQGTMLFEQNAPAPFAGLVTIDPAGSVAVQLHPTGDLALNHATLHAASATLKISASNFLGGPLAGSYVVMPLDATTGNESGATASFAVQTTVSANGGIDAAGNSASSLASGAFKIATSAWHVHLAGAADAYDAYRNPSAYMKAVDPSDPSAASAAWKGNAAEGVTFASGTIATPYGGSLAFDANAGTVGFGYAALSYGEVSWAAFSKTNGNATEADGFGATVQNFDAIVSGTTFAASIDGTLVIAAPTNATAPARFRGLAADGTLSQATVPAKTTIALRGWGDAALTLQADAATEQGKLVIASTNVTFAGLPSQLAGVNAAGAIASDGTVVNGAFSALTTAAPATIASLPFTATAFEFGAGTSASGLAGTFAVPGWQPADAAIAHVTSSGGSLAPLKGTVVALQRTLGNGGASVTSVALMPVAGTSGWSGVGMLNDGHSLAVKFGLAVDGSGMRGGIGLTAADIAKTDPTGFGESTVNAIVQHGVKGAVAFATDGTYTGLTGATSDSTGVGSMTLKGSTISLGAATDVSADACNGHICIDATLDYDVGGGVSFHGNSKLEIVDGVQASLDGYLANPVIRGDKQDANGNYLGIGVAGQLDYYEDTGDWDLGFAAASIPVFSGVDASAAICIWSHSKSPGSCSVYPGGGGPAFVGKGLGLYLGVDIDIGVGTLGGEIDGSVNDQKQFYLHEHGSGSFEVFDVGISVDVDLAYGNAPPQLSGSINAYFCFCECVGVGGDIVVSKQNGVSVHVHLRRKACIGFL